MRNNAPNILAKIAAATGAALDASHPPLAELKAAARDLAPRRGFMRALSAASTDGAPALIAEIKKASPSAGMLVAEFDPARCARAYAAGGAACLSVLTDVPFFQGSLADLRKARAACALPVLRKDFLLDGRQLYAAAIAGADAVLLIAALLPPAELSALMALAQELQMDPLVEVHDEAEMARAQKAGAQLIGVNNRNLRDFTTNLDVSFALAPLAPQDALLVSESGISTPAHRRALGEAGYRGMLVGEHLLRQKDWRAACAALLA